MAITWILVTNGSLGKVLELKKHGGEISQVRSFLHPRTAKKEIDTPENINAPGGPQFHHAIDYSGEMEDHEREVFAKEIVEFLAKAFAQNHYNKLILVASPNMLGQLRQELPSALKKVLLHDLSKDLITPGLSNIELIEKIQSDLGLVHL